MARGSGKSDSPAIIQFWDREVAPGYVGEMLATFRDGNPDMRHLVFSEQKAAQLIAKRFGRREVEAFRACAVPAMQADYFRYCALHALGGVYADADFRCISPLRSLLDGSASGTLFGRAELPPRWRTSAFEWRERVGPYRVVMNSLFAFPSPGHPLLELAIEIATANVEERVGEDVALVTGPAIFTSLYLLRELGSFGAFIDYAQGGALEPFSRLLCETIGNHDRVVRAFDGVRLLPVEETERWVGSPESPLPYKEGESHWTNVKASIYR